MSEKRFLRVFYDSPEQLEAIQKDYGDRCRLVRTMPQAMPPHLALFETIDEDQEQPPPEAVSER